MLRRTVGLMAALMLFLTVAVSAQNTDFNRRLIVGGAGSWSTSQPADAAEGADRILNTSISINGLYELSPNVFIGGALDIRDAGDQTDFCFDPGGMYILPSDGFKPFATVGARCVNEDLGWLVGLGGLQPLNDDGSINLSTMLSYRTLPSSLDDGESGNEARIDVGFTLFLR